MTQNCQSNPEEKEQNKRHNPLRLQTILQSYSNQNSMVLAQKETIGKWNRMENPKINPHYLQSISLEQRRQEYTVEKKQSLQQMVLRKLKSYM